MSEGRIAAASAALLVGGASTRMGRDKARLAVAGEALATRLARLLDGLFDEVLLVGGDPPADAPGRRVADPPGPRCALRGLVGALAAASAERVAVVATDLPALRADLVLALLAAPAADAVVPRTRGGLEPLCALYRRDAVLPRAQERLAAGQLRLVDLLADLRVSVLEGPDLAPLDPEGLALRNANTPEELEEIEARLVAAGADAP